MYTLACIMLRRYDKKCVMDVGPCDDASGALSFALEVCMAGGRVCWPGELPVLPLPESVVLGGLMGMSVRCKQQTQSQLWMRVANSTNFAPIFGIWQSLHT
mmetsp:Transcript_25069/g.49064  ORF Transcript_25069/g.49064 Transcript_25069/m.49064 type:complete len:101 (+) Transcript_25069:161-463(+)